MSAFMVDRAHIDAMVRLALWGPKDGPGRDWGHLAWYIVPLAQLREDGIDWSEWSNYHRVANPEEADAIGTMLALTNCASLRARYSDADESGMTAAWADDYTYSRRGAMPTAVEGLKLLACFEYQACEHGGWHGSEARQFCSSLRLSLINSLAGYDEAPWVWDGRVKA